MLTYAIQLSVCADRQTRTAMKPLTIDVGTDENGRHPVCPHCGRELRVITDYRSHLKFMSNMHVFCCSECNTVLSVTAVSK